MKKKKREIFLSSWLKFNNGLPNLRHFNVGRFTGLSLSFSRIIALECIHWQPTIIFKYRYTNTKRNSFKNKDINSDGKKYIYDTQHLSKTHNKHPAVLDFLFYFLFFAGAWAASLRALRESSVWVSVNISSYKDDDSSPAAARTSEQRGLRCSPFPSQSWTVSSICSC